MKKFIFKTALFVLPFFSIHVFYLMTSENHVLKDLNRIGKLNIDYDYFSKYPESKLDTIYFEYFANHTKNNYKVLNIGDSFSRQEMKGTSGYVNFLAKQHTLLNMPFSKPFERIEDLLNNNILDTINVDYVILQSVHRNILNKLNSVKEKSIKSKHQLREYDVLKRQKFLNEFSSVNEKSVLFSRHNLYYVLNALLKKDIQGKVIISKTKENLFSYDENKLVFYADDIKGLEEKNNIAEIKKANEKLNILSKKLKNRGIKLIVIIPPDKYDFYYDDLIKPLNKKLIFYDVLDSLKKDYIYFNPKKVLRKNKDFKKDLYFFDDTHWSPIASKIIAEKINELIK